MALHATGDPPCGVTLKVQPALLTVTPWNDVFAEMAEDVFGPRVDA